VQGKFLGSALVIAVIMFLGFSRNYYLRHWLGTRNLSLAAYLHGLIMTMWVPFLSMAEAVAAAGRAFEVHHSLLNILFIVIAYSVYNSYYACYEDHNRLGSQESVWRSDGSCTTPACQHHPERPTLGGGDFG
jgi:hypothetical protein